MCSSSPNIPDPKTDEELRKERRDAEPADVMLGDEGGAKTRSLRSQGMRRFTIPVASNQSNAGGVQIK